MQQIKVKMVKDHDTKHTRVFAAKKGQGLVAIRTLYLDLEAVGNASDITVTVDEDQD